MHAHLEVVREHHGYNPHPTNGCVAACVVCNGDRVWMMRVVGSPLLELLLNRSGKLFERIATLCGAKAFDVFAAMMRADGVFLVAYHILDVA